LFLFLYNSRAKDEEELRKPAVREPEEDPEVIALKHDWILDLPDDPEVPDPSSESSEESAGQLDDNLRKFYEAHLLHRRLEASMLQMKLVSDGILHEGCRDLKIQITKRIDTNLHFLY
jgi:hypothetical protein